MNDSQENVLPPAVGGSYRYSVDGILFATTDPVLTGAQIKARATVEPAFQLFLESSDGRADRQIGDADSVDFTQPGQEQLYTMPPANFGS